MAKLLIKKKTVAINDLESAQSFTQIRVQNQVGDKFFIPNESMLLIRGTKVPRRDASGNEIKNEKGEVETTQAGQRFYGVRIIDGKAIDVQELYVGQLIKVDANRRIAFPGILSSALRVGDKAFKNTICNKILTVTDEKEIDDRVWDSENNRWMRNPDDNKFVTRTGRALKFEPGKHNLSKEEEANCYKILTEYYKANFSDEIDVE